MLSKCNVKFSIQKMPMNPWNKSSTSYPNVDLILVKLFDGLFWYTLKLVHACTGCYFSPGLDNRQALPDWRALPQY